MKSPKIDNSGAEQAARAQAESQAISNNLAKNFQTDLSSQNTASIQAGGTADAVDTSTMGAKRKKAATSLSSTLGISA